MAERKFKPVIIDYPKDREFLKEEFKKISEMLNSKESLKLVKKMLSGK